jgi:hypothetical protein
MVARTDSGAAGSSQPEHLLANRRLDLHRHCGPGRHGIGECRERPQWTLPNGTLMTRRSRYGSGLSGLGHRGGPSSGRPGRWSGDHQVSSPRVALHLTLTWPPRASCTAGSRIVPSSPWSDGLKLTVARCEPGPGTPRGFGQRSGTQLWRVQAISKRAPSSATSRSTTSRLRSAHRPDARSSRRLCTALCSASGPTLAHTDIPRRT